MKKWQKLPKEFQTAEVRPYYDALCHKKTGLFCKRVFDVVVSALMLLILWPVFLLLAAAIKLDSPGPVFYRQERVTQYGRHFCIHKFRSMVQGADRKGTLVTVSNDARITRMGRILRGCRLDELPQLIDILKGDMSFVGTRPEVPKYVAVYSPEMMATLLLPAGVTSLTSIQYKDESALLDAAEDPDAVYIERILPEKMKINLKGLEDFSFWGDVRIMLMTVGAVLGICRY